MEEPHEDVISASNETTVELSDIIRKVEFPFVLDGNVAVTRAPPGRELLWVSPYSPCVWRYAPVPTRPAPPQTTGQ